MRHDPISISMKFASNRTGLKWILVMALIVVPLAHLVAQDDTDPGTGSTQ